MSDFSDFLPGVPNPDKTYPWSCNMLTTDPDAVGQGTWARAINAAYPYNVNFLNTSAADGDNFSVEFRVPAGTYTIRFNASKASARPIVDVYIDAVEVDSVDLYAGVADHLNVAEMAGVAISSAPHTLKFDVDGKNGSSGGYYFVTQGVTFVRTGA